MEKMLEETKLGSALPDPEAGRRMFWTIVRAIGPTLQADDRRAMAEALPAEVGNALLDGRYREATDAAALYAEVARKSRLSTGMAREVTQAVAQAIARRLDPELRERLARHADATLGALWTTPPAPLPRAQPRRRYPSAKGPTHTLATGRPGSRHPLCEAGAGSPDAR